MTSNQGIVTALAFGGEGIIRSKGKVIFIPFTAIGDEITYEITEEKKQFARGKLLSILKPSPDRTNPLCPHFGTCGGCQLQHIDYSAQLKQKQQFVKDALHRIGGIDFPVSNLIPSPSPWYYRKHITLHLRVHQGRFQAGYIASNFLPITQCPIFLPPENLFLKHLQSFLDQLEPREGDVRLISTEEGIVLAFSFENPPPSFQKVAASELPHWRGIALKDQTWGITSIPLSIGSIHFQLSPYSFMQNHRLLTPTLYQDLLNLSQGPKVLDLYCGPGILSILLAQKGYEVMGVESDPIAIEAAQHNGATYKLNILFQLQRVEKALSRLLQDFKPQDVILNPPRGGLHPMVTDNLQSNGPPSLLYMSCMPPTLARDLKGLSSYRLSHLSLYDMFPQTTHLEVIARLERKK